MHSVMNPGTRNVHLLISSLRSCSLLHFASQSRGLCRINRQTKSQNSIIWAGSGSTAHIPLSQAGNPRCSHTGSQGTSFPGGFWVLGQGLVEPEAGGRQKDVCLILEGSEPSEGQSSLWVSVFILQREGRATRASGDISAFEFLGL